MKKRELIDPMIDRLIDDQCCGQCLLETYTEEKLSRVCRVPLPKCVEYNWNDSFETLFLFCFVLSRQNIKEFSTKMEQI